MPRVVRALLHQMVDRLPNVHPALTFLAADQHLALCQQVPTLIHAAHVHETVVAGRCVLLSLLLPLMLLLTLLLLPVPAAILLLLTSFILAHLLFIIVHYSHLALGQLGVGIATIGVDLRWGWLVDAGAIEVRLLAVLELVLISLFGQL